MKYTSTRLYEDMCAMSVHGHERYITHAHMLGLFKFISICARIARNN